MTELLRKGNLLLPVQTTMRSMECAKIGQPITLSRTLDDGGGVKLPNWIAAAWALQSPLLLSPAPRVSSPVVT